MKIDLFRHDDIFAMSRHIILVLERSMSHNLQGAMSRKGMYV